MQPFGVEDRNKLYKSIMKCDYHFDEDDWKYVSEEAKSFVEMLLEGNMYRRMTADDALEHPWVSTARPHICIHISEWCNSGCTKVEVLLHYLCCGMLSPDEVGRRFTVKT